MKYSVGFIGAGNMGGALIEAACRTVPADTIAIYDKDFAKAKEKAISVGANVVDIKELVSRSDFVFLGVKPNIISIVAGEIKKYISADTVVVSMAAGVDITALSNELNTRRIIRIMPNTPVSVGEGMILYSLGKDVSKDNVNAFLNILSCAGQIDFIEEKFIDAAAALSGCGPAFVYMFAEALADGAVKCGLSRDKALLYAKQTIIGSGKMMLMSQKHPEQLKDEVCSPGGTTIEGVLSLENGGFRHTASSAVVAAYEKTSKLK